MIDLKSSANGFGVSKSSLKSVFEILYLRKKVAPRRVGNFYAEVVVD